MQYATESLTSFIDKQFDEIPLFEKIVFYDEVPFNLSKPLKRIASKLDSGKYKNKSVYFLASMYSITLRNKQSLILDGITSVKNKYEFIWNAKEEDTTYPSLILDDFLYLGEEDCSLEKVLFLFRIRVSLLTKCRK